MSLSRHISLFLVFVEQIDVAVDVAQLLNHTNAADTVTFLVKRR